MNAISIRGTEMFATPMARMADNEAAERMPDNEAAEISAPVPPKAPLRADEGSLLDVTV